MVVPINCYFDKEIKKINFKNKNWRLTLNNGEIKNYNKLILTCPFPQLQKLSKNYINHNFINQKIKMDANITVMIEIKKIDINVSSFLFNDDILGWAGKENSKNRLNFGRDTQ